MATPDERALITQFVSQRISRTTTPNTSPGDLITAYRAFCSAASRAPVNAIEFTREIMSAGIVYQRSGQEYQWFCHIRALDDNAPTIDAEPEESRRISIRQQLETMRNETFSAVCALRNAGKHSMAALNIKAYRDIIEMGRDVFPVDPASIEGADVYLPEEIPLDAHGEPAHN